MTDIVGRFVPAHSDADEIERLRDRLAEAERLLRKAANQLDPRYQPKLMDAIDAFLAGEKHE